MKTFLIYDLETSGLLSIDQVLSYAAIRVNEQLEIIEKKNIEVAWRRDTVPSVGAYLVHQIAMTGRNTVSELDAMKEIHGHLNQRNTISGGYNTLGFDDEMLRFSFYRCLLPPYTHQYQSGCGRFDVLPIVVFYYLYAKDTIAWPEVEGRPSFKLENLNAQNKWVKGRAHEAMVDVEVTLSLMKALKKHASMWQYLIGFFDKKTDQCRTEALLNAEGLYQGVGVMVSLSFGYSSLYHVPVFYLGAHQVYKNQVVLLRLDQDIEEKEELSSLIVRKKYGEPGFILPYVDKYQDKLSDAVKALVKKNCERLKKQDLNSLKNTLCAQVYPSLEHVDIDASLYQKGFFDANETRWCQQFHQQLAGILSTCPNQHIEEQALRFLWRFYPDALPEDKKEAALQSIQHFIKQSVDYKNRPGMRIETVLSDLEAVSSNVDPSLQKGLDEIRDHVNQMLAFNCTE